MPREARLAEPNSVDELASPEGRGCGGTYQEAHNHPLEDRQTGRDGCYYALLSRFADLLSNTDTELDAAMFVKPQGKGQR